MRERTVRAAGRELVAGWLLALEGADEEVAVRFRYLVARAAERAGLLRAALRATVGGRARVCFAGPSDGGLYAVEDPALGGAEARLVEATAWVLLGDGR